MTISDPQENRNEYTAQLSQTIFPYTYKIFTDEDLDVYQNSVLQIVNVDYSVTNVGVDGGGNVVFMVATALDDKIIISRDIPFTRTFDYVQSGDLTADSVNQSFEKSRAIEQQVRELILERGLTYAATDDLTTGNFNTIPLLGPNQVWQMSADGMDIIAADVVESTDISTLRTDLAKNADGDDGAMLVGYFSPNNGATTVDQELDFLSPPVSDLNNLIKNDADNTKQVKFDLSAIATATTRTIFVPDLDVTMGVPAFYTRGFRMENSSGDPLHDIIINIGIANKGFTNSIFTLQSTITKQADANWAEGTAAGGMASALTIGSNIYYHVFLINKPDGSVDAGFDTDISATNLLADAAGSGYTDFLRIGSIRTREGVATILPFVHTLLGAKRLMMFEETANVINIINLSATPITVTFKAPLGVSTELVLNTHLSSVTANVPINIYNPDVGAAITPMIPGTLVTSDNVSTRLLSVCNTLGQLNFTASLAVVVSLNISVIGFYDNVNSI